MQLRFASFAVINLRWDLHPQERAHAGRTKKARRGAGQMLFSFIERDEEDYLMNNPPLIGMLAPVM